MGTMAVDAMATQWFLGCMTANFPGEFLTRECSLWSSTSKDVVEEVVAGEEG